MFRTCTHTVHMSKMVQIRNVPDDIHRELKSRAALSGKTLSDFLLSKLQEIVSIPTKEEMWERLKSREQVHLGSSVADILRDEREKRG